LEEVRVVGVLTLENVIERLLQIDINDERDREVAIKNMLDDKPKVKSSSALDRKNPFKDSKLG